MIVYLNGEYVNEKRARIDPSDRGFLLGDGLFETVRVYSGKPFALDRHLDRLADGARKLEIAGLPDIEKLGEIARAVLSKNGLKSARLRITVTRGEEGCDQPTLLVKAAEFFGYPERLYASGASAISLAGYRLSSATFSMIKSTSFLTSVLATLAAKRAGADEALLLNERGEVAEGAVSNAFIVRDGAVFTPPLSAGALPGVIRALVLEISAWLGIPASERSLTLDDFAVAEEAFLTNSLMEVVPLAKLDGFSIGSGKPGPVTIELSRALKELIERECG